MATKSVNLGKVKGEDAKINGVNSLTITDGTGISTSQSGSTLTISVDADTTPTANSAKPLTSGGAKTAFDTKQNSTLSSAINVEGTSSATVETALRNLNSKKMKKVTGTPGQVLSFDSSGNPVAVDPNDGVEVYGFRINQNESNPKSMITYLGSCKNANYTPAGLSSNNVFSYGSWADAWFIKNIKVVLMNYNGTIAKELNKNNYAKDTSGNTVNISSACTGNVMVGIPTVWIKVVPEDDTDEVYNVYIASAKLDDDYYAWAHTDVNGDIMPYTYISAYEGYNDGSKMRSVSGVKPNEVNKTYDVQVSDANAVNTAGSVSDVWDIHSYSDRNLINYLLLLIGRNADTQTQFGYGVVSGGESGVMNTGTMNTAGLFSGTTANQTTGVKVFGIEQFWGNLWDRVQGLINDSGKYKVKLCKGTSDGSTNSQFSAAGAGYIEISTPTPPGNAYVKSFHFSRNGILPRTTGSYSTTYYCDYFYANNATNIINVALFGSDSTSGLIAGAFFVSVGILASHSGWSVGASLSDASRYKKI